MATSRRLVPRTGGEYKDGSGWTYNVRKSVAAIKASAARVTGTLTLTPSRTSCLTSAHVLFNATTTMPTTNVWYRDVEFVFFYNDDGATFHRMDATTYTDLLGRSAELSLGYRGVHVWEKSGTKTVTCFAYNTSNNTWDEETVAITVGDPLSFFPQANRYIVAADGDYTGAPAADNYYTDYLVAIEAARIADEDGLVLVKRNQTYTVSGLTGNGPAFRQTDAHWHIDAWGEGTPPKIICDFGRSPRGSGFAILHVLLECASFTVANLDFTGLYNSSISSQIIEGETVLSGHCGGAGNSQDVEIMYVGFGGTVVDPAPANHVTLYGCSVQRVAKAMTAQTGNYCAVYNCNIKEWADYGVFHTHALGFSLVGCTAKVRDDCLHVGGSKIYDALPREPFHGALRSAQAVNAVVYNNDAYTKNGWFSGDTCQPPLRIHSSGANSSSPNISVVCSRNICTNGDGPIIFVPANPTIPSQFTDDALFDSNILIGQQHQYDGFKISQACVVRNTLAIQQDVTRESPNDVWQSTFLTHNGATTNGTDLAIYAQEMAMYCYTAVYMLSEQGSVRPWLAISNAADGDYRGPPAFTNTFVDGVLTYAPNLETTTQNQVDPLFDSAFVPNEGTFVNSEARPLGAALDIYGNLRPALCNLGAVQAPPQD